MTQATAPVAGDGDLSGRVALVTGGDGAIGRALARALVQRGAKVIAADVGFTAAPSTCDFAAASADVHLDVSSQAQITALTSRIVDALGRIDLLVNVAGIVSRGTAEELAEDEWDRVLRINLKGTFLCCQAVMPAMKARRYGRIVNIGSVIGKNGGNARPWLNPDEQRNSGNVAYGVSKAGIHTLTAFLAKELAAHGITVNAVAPGPIATTMTTNFPDALRALIPAGRMGKTEDVVDAILFLVSGRAGYISGEVLDVNGALWCD